MSLERAPDPTPSVSDVLREEGFHEHEPDPAKSHFRVEGLHANQSLGETAEDAKETVKEKLTTVTKAEFEAWLAEGIRIFLRGGIHVHHEGTAAPGFELKITDDAVVVNLRNLDDALAWQLASGPADVPPPEPSAEQVLDHFRVFVLLEDEPVAALGRGIPGVQLRTGRASFLLLKDLVKGLLADKAAAAREKRAQHERELLRREIEYSRERADARVPETGRPPVVESGQERLPGPSFEQGP